MITIWPTILANTFFETRLAVGLFGYIRGYGRVRPTEIYQHEDQETDLALTRHRYRNNDEEINVQELG